MTTTIKYHEINFTWPKGFYSDGLNAGMRHKRPDLGWLYSEVPAAAAGVYTTNKVCAAPTTLTKKLITTNQELQALIMNSVFANSCTGSQGMKDALLEQELVAQKLQIKPSLVGVASTGLIGSFLPMDKITAGIAQLKETTSDAVTQAVMTTDTHAKKISVAFKLAGKTCTMTGFAKGSGMIHPNMATMLAFITTDAAIDLTILQKLTSELTDKTFNQITVDGDTSTNDMVVVLANGLAQNKQLTTAGTDLAVFKATLHHVLAFLAQKIAADGEGATKLVEVNVNGATSLPDGQKVAKAIVGSNLVKAALFGNDPNWGRIMSTIGTVDAVFDPQNITIKLNDILVVDHSLAVAFDEKQASTTMAASKVVITVDLHSGSAQGQAWGCDLTYNYVKINASYRS
ncbi:bifunctional glutamate N-acetyltransferase/amino-acid acetyltransferase ArgJ [Liquorilactobacillus capillatus]|uniref:Arginine biosynthesis bifunctional protein ArgJ n=1 Tax=Liquorilactobacillus capillatus DSM 19910 TaxID=1423731 RepID=A0A0R1M5Q6_9LACO|nr:bifunctional glutamate N-acetyltransferase/amino-acid acetyltransferase ArgJ [Liquorilactobacillus capillatus]KRL00884.1 bifunctional ornithine acetyltransferase N-acetylglutamate synthase protein [Liquorilactobacillus capillatus DSM 19910]